ncbi:MAG: hypothetical protein NVS3B20_08780 [Polyangiales bacterium]
MNTDLSDELEFEVLDEAGDGQRRRYLTPVDASRLILESLERADSEGAALLLKRSPPRVSELLALRAEKLPRETCALVTAMFLAVRDVKRAVSVAAFVGDPLECATMFERAEVFEQAGLWYEKATKLDRAAEMYERDQKFERALPLWEKAGRIDRAAALLERLGRPTHAGRLWANIKKFDRAIQLLEKVDRRHGEFISATLLLGKILEHQGLGQAAAARYLEVVKHFPLDKNTVEIFERLGLIYRTVGDERSALKLLSAVQTFDPQRAPPKPQSVPERRPSIPSSVTTAAPVAPLAADEVAIASRDFSETRAVKSHVSKSATLQSGDFPTALTPRAAVAVAPLAIPPAPFLTPLVLPGASPPTNSSATAARTDVAVNKPLPIAATATATANITAISVASLEQKVATAQPIPATAAVVVADPSTVASSPKDAVKTSHADARILPAHLSTLKSAPIFAELSSDDLAALLELGELCTYAEGELMIEQDRDVRRMMVILSGTALITRKESTGEKPLGQMTQGSPLGELALVDEGPSPAQTRAKDEVVVFRFPIDKLRGHLQRNETVAVRIYRATIRSLSARLRKRNSPKLPG